MDIARFRRQRQLSQEQVAEATGLSQSTVQRLEVQHSTARLENYRRYADYFEVKLADLFNEDLTEAELALLRVFRRTPAERRGELLELLRRAQRLALPPPSEASGADLGEDHEAQQ